MSRLEQVLCKAYDDLHRNQVPVALVGGLAVSAYGEPRFTRDADFAAYVANDRDAETLIHSLQGNGYQVLAVVEQQVQKRLATVRLATRGIESEQVVVDLLFASSGIEREITMEAQTLEIFPQFSLPVARIGHLLALKILCRDDRRRPQDIADLRNLLKVADAEETQLAIEALYLIEQRGFGREKDLQGAWQALLREKAE